MQIVSLGCLLRRQFAGNIKMSSSEKFAQLAFKALNNKNYQIKHGDNQVHTNNPLSAKQNCSRQQSLFFCFFF